MKARVLAVSLLLIVLPGCLLDAQSSPPNSGSPSGSSDSSVHLSSSDLQQLVGPIALYSDPLLALVLPASTYPQEIAQAEAYLNQGGTPAGIAFQNWDKSVQGLAHYPEVLHMMASNLDWTNQLGAAVLAQQGDVMTAVQAMRVKAKTLGNLVTTPQQTVTTENNVVEITPANPQTVYVPTYDPAVVYVRPAPVVVGAAPWVTFGGGCALGAWADFGVHWGGGVGVGFGGGGGFICSGGFYRGSFGWSSSSHSWSSSHYPWHRDWSRGGSPHPLYHPGNGGHLPPWNHQDNNHWSNNSEHSYNNDHWSNNSEHSYNNDHWSSNAEHSYNNDHWSSNAEHSHDSDHDNSNAEHSHDSDHDNSNAEHSHDSDHSNSNADHSHDNDHSSSGGHNGDKGGGHDGDHGSHGKGSDPHQHNSKENHDRPQHHAEHHATEHHASGGHHGGGGHKK